MKIAIVKYNAGNIYSVVNALHRLGAEPMITDKAEELMGADRILFPGQGEACSTMSFLKDHCLYKLKRQFKKTVRGLSN